VNIASISVKSIALLTLSLLTLLTKPTHAGLSLGGVTSTSSCYSAIQNAHDPSSENIDKNGYVSLINELSKNAFTSFQFNEDLSEWGQFPVSDFNDLPLDIRNEFYIHACGGANVYCQNAFLYSEGTGPGVSGGLDKQQEVYLFQLCKGIEKAIKDEVTPDPPVPVTPTPPTSVISTGTPTVKPTFPGSPTYNPTPEPPPTLSPTPTLAPVPATFSGPLSLQLTYQATVSSSMSTQEMQLSNSTTRQALLGTMNRWSAATAKEKFDFSGSDFQISQRAFDIVSSSQSSQTAGTHEVTAHSRVIGGGERRRELLVLPIPMVEFEFGKTHMDITELECTPEILTNKSEEGDHCIQVTTNLTLQFADEPLGSQNETLEYYSTKFQDDLIDGTFYNVIDAETQAQVRAVYPAPAPVTVVEPGDNVGSGNIPVPAPDNAWLNELIEGNPAEEEKKSSNTVGIVSGVCVSLAVVAVIIGAFLYRRRQRYDYDDYSKSGSDSYSKDFDAKDDLERGMGNASRSSRDEFSSGDSQSSSSMQSYSGSESGTSTSSGGSRSSGTSRSSRSSYTSQSGTDSRSYSHTSSSYSDTPDGGEMSDGGPASVTASEGESHSSSSNAGSHIGNDDPDAPDGIIGDAQRDVANAPALDRSATTDDSEYSSRSGVSTRDSGSLYSIKEDSASGSNGGGASNPANTEVYAEDGHISMGSTSRGSQSSSRGDYAANADLMDDQDSNQDTRDSSEGVYRANVDLMDTSPSSSQQDTSKVSSTPTDDDSSAGSSGWDSEDGDSSVNTGSVSSYDPGTILTGDLGSSTATSTSGTLGDSEGLRRSEEDMMNPAVNPVVQRGVTMLPIEEAQREASDEESAFNSAAVSDESPMGGVIQEAIEKGDWGAVAGTAAILANTSSDAMSVDEQEEGSGDFATRTSRRSDDSTLDDDVRAAEIDQLVETGNWDGVVAVAARYADEADEADDQLGLPMYTQPETSPSKPSGSKSSGSKSSGSKLPSLKDSISSSTHDATKSAGSVSVETADASSVYSSTTRDSESHTTFSVGTMSGSGSDSQTPPDVSTFGSSITSSYVSGGITESMVSAVSSVDLQEKGQMNAYRAEVEALVRRVVPDEIDNVDDIMVQFSGRENELIETLRAMQEKSIAQRARAAVQRSAKKEAGRSGRDLMDDESSEDFGQSYTTDGGQSMTTDGQSATTNSRSAHGRRGTSDSMTEHDSKGDADDYSTSSGSSGSGSMSSYYSGTSDSRSNVTGSEYSESQYSESTGVSIGKSRNDLSDAIDASDWRAVGEAAKNLGGGREVKPGASDDDLEDQIDKGNWTGIIESASNMTSGRARRRTDDSIDDDID